MRITRDERIITEVTLDEREAQSMGFSAGSDVGRKLRDVISGAGDLSKVTIRMTSKKHTYTDTEETPREDWT